MSDTTAVMATNLRAAADLMDEHPDLPVPYITTRHNGDVFFNWFLMHNDTDQKTAAASIMRTLRGSWQKRERGNALDFKSARPGLSLEFTVQREAVCTRRVVGTETVTIPAVEAQPERTEKRAVVEWDCAPVLAEAVVS